MSMLRTLPRKKSTISETSPAEMSASRRTFEIDARTKTD